MEKTLYVDADLLAKKIDESGLKLGFICEKLGLSREGFRRKSLGKCPFKIPEVFVLCEILPITQEEKPKIFYPKTQPESCGQKGE